MAAGLSFAARSDHDMGFYTVVRASMLTFGAVIAWHAATHDAPLWLAVMLAMVTWIFLPFFKPPKPVWLVLNPLVSLLYLTHAAWLGLQAMGGA